MIASTTSLMTLMLNNDVCKIPYELSQNGIHHRSDFILSAPDGIKVSHFISAITIEFSAKVTNSYRITKLY